MMHKESDEGERENLLNEQGKYAGSKTQTNKNSI